MGRAHGSRCDVRAVRHLRLPPALPLAPPAAPAAQRVEGPVARDRQYPRHEWPAPGVELIHMAPHLHEHVAQDLVRFVLVAQNVQCETADPGRDEVIQLCERAFVACLEAPLEGALLHLTKTFWRGHLDSHTSSEPGRIQPRSCILKARARRWDGGSLPG